MTDEAEVSDNAQEDQDEIDKALAKIRAAKGGKDPDAALAALRAKPVPTGHKDASGKVTPFVAPRSDEGYLERLATHVLNTAQGFPGMESIEALAASGPQSGTMGTNKTRTGAKVPAPLSFEEARSRLRANTEQIAPDVSTGEQIVGGTALASGLGGATLKGLGAAPAILEHAPVIGRAVRAGRTLGRILDRFAPPVAEAATEAQAAIKPVEGLTSIMDPSIPMAADATSTEGAALGSRSGELDPKIFKQGRTNLQRAAAPRPASTSPVIKPSGGPVIEGYQRPMETLDDLAQGGPLEKGPQSLDDLVESQAAPKQRHGTKARFKMIEERLGKSLPDPAHAEPPASPQQYEGDGPDLEELLRESIRRLAHRKP